MPKAVLVGEWLISISCVNDVKFCIFINFNKAMRSSHCVSRFPMQIHYSRVPCILYCINKRQNVQIFDHRYFRTESFAGILKIIKTIFYSKILVFKNPVAILTDLLFPSLNSQKTFEHTLLV